MNYSELTHWDSTINSTSLKHVVFLFLIEGVLYLHVVEKDIRMLFERMMMQLDGFLASGCDVKQDLESTRLHEIWMVFCAD